MVETSAHGNRYRGTELGVDELHIINIVNSSFPVAARRGVRAARDLAAQPRRRRGSYGEADHVVPVERLLAGGRRVQLRQPEVHVLLVGRHREYLVQTLHQLVEHRPLVRVVTPAIAHYHVYFQGTARWFFHAVSAL